MQNKHYYTVEKLEPSKYAKLQAELSKIKGVLSLEIDDGGNLSYTVDEWTDEYDVMVDVMNKIAEEGGELGFLEDEQKPVANDLPEELLDEPAEEEQEVKTDDTEKPKKKKDKKPFSENMQRAIELCVSAALLLLNFFIDFGDSFSNIVLLIVFAVSGYEIIYDAICEISNKNIINTPLLITLSSLISLFLGNTYIGALTAFIYSCAYWACLVLKDKYSFSSTLTEKFKKGSCYLLSAGKEKKVKADKICVGDEVVLHKDEIAFFDCKAVRGEGNVERVIDGQNKYLKVKKGEYLNCGERLLDGEITVEVIRVFADTAAAKEEHLDKIKDAKAEKKSRLIFNIAVLAFSLLYTFIAPIFKGEDYAYQLSLCAKTGAALLTLAGIGYLFDSLKDVIFNAYVCLKNDSIGIKDAEVIEKLAKAKYMVFDKNGTLTDGKYKAEEVCFDNSYKGKLLGIVKSLSSDLLHEKYPISKGGITIGYLADFEEKPPAVDGVGIKIYIKKGDVFIGALLYKEEIYPDSEGALRELRDLGIEEEYLLSSESKEYTSALRTQFSMYNSFGQLTGEQKREKLDGIVESKKDGVVFVGNSEIYGGNVSISMGDNSADAVIKNKEISYVPLAVKVSKKAYMWRKICAISYIALKSASLLLILLLGMSAIWGMVITSATMLLCALSSILNRKTA